MKTLSMQDIDDALLIPREIAELIRLGRNGVFEKGDRQAVFAMAQWPALISKMWVYVGPADQERLDRVALAQEPAVPPAA